MHSFVVEILIATTCFGYVK